MYPQSSAESQANGMPIGQRCLVGFRGGNETTPSAVGTKIGLQIAEVLLTVFCCLRRCPVASRPKNGIGNLYVLYKAELCFCGTGKGVKLMNFFQRVICSPRIESLGAPIVGFALGTNTKPLFIHVDLALHKIVLVPTIRPGSGRVVFMQIDSLAGFPPTIGFCSGL